MNFTLENAKLINILKLGFNNIILFILFILRITLVFILPLLI